MKSALEFIKQRNEYIILAPLLFWGFFLRIYKVGELSFWFDEGISVLASMRIIETGLPLLESGWLYTGHLLHNYLMAIPLALFGINETSARIVSVIAGTLTILVIYLLVKKVFDRPAATIAAIFITFSTIQIAWSRQARSYALAQLFLYLALLFYFRYVENGRGNDMYFFFSSFLLCVLSQLQGFIFAIPIGLHILLFHRQRIRIHFILAGIAVLLYTIYFFNPFAYFGQLLPFTFAFKNYFLTYSGFFKRIYLFFILLSIAALFSYSFRKTSLFYLLFISHLIIYSFLVKLFALRYMFLIIPVIFILAAVTISTLVKNKYLITVTTIFILFFLVTFAILPRPVFYLEVDTPQPNFRAAFQYVEENIKPGEIFITTHPGMSEIYFRKPDYSIWYSLTGLEKTFDETDQYTAVRNIENLTAYGPGYLLIDGMSYNKLRSDTLQQILQLPLVVELSEGGWHDSQVYKIP